MSRIYATIFDNHGASPILTGWRNSVLILLQAGTVGVGGVDRLPIITLPDYVFSTYRGYLHIIHEVTSLSPTGASKTEHPRGCGLVATSVSAASRSRATTPQR